MDTGSLTNLSNDPAWESFPVVSPDGTRIAFLSNRGGASGQELFVMDIDGGNVRRVSDELGNVMLPVWSPDSSAIAVMVERDQEIWTSRSRPARHAS